MFLMIFDDSKRTVEEKIAGAMRLYRERYSVDARIVLTHPDQCIQRADVLVVTGESQGIPVQRNTFWMGIN